MLDEAIITDAVDEAVRLLQGDDVADGLDAIEAQFADVTRQRVRLVSAIASGGQLPGLLDGLREREATRVRLTTERDAVRSQRGLQASEVDHVRHDLHALSADWRRVLADDPMHARPIVSSLLKGRVTFTPQAPRRWRLNGEGTLIGLFSREMTGRGLVPKAVCASVEVRTDAIE